MAVARDGQRRHPTVPPPQALRPYLGFRRLTGPALDAALRALEADDEFRLRVRTAFEASAPAVGEPAAAEAGPVPSTAAALLVLDQPEGWRVDLRAMAAVVEADAEEHDAVARARRLDRDRERLRAARDDAVAEARAADERLAGAERELAEAREAATGLQARLDEAARATAALDEQRQRAVRDLKATEAWLATQRDELRLTLDDLRRLRGERDDLRRRVEELEAPAASDAGVDPGPPAAPDARGEPTGSPSAEAEPDERALIATALAEVADAAAGLTAALRSVSQVVAGPPAPVPAEPPAGAVGPPTGVRTGSTGGAERRGVGAVVRRAPPLPAGVFDDSLDAARHLVRLPGAVVLVDGYNVSLEGWPSLPLHEQRGRLIDGLAALAARTGCQPLVVFDGAEAGRGLPGESLPRGVQVRFSAPGVEADDELLALVGAFPLDRPVVVVSSDRRVVTGSADRGAASLSASQLLGLLAA